MILSSLMMLTFGLFTCLFVIGGVAREDGFLGLVGFGFGLLTILMYKLGGF